MTYRIVVKEIARQNGYYATFMPKPARGVNGSGMHMHQSLFQGDRNAFYAEDDDMRLSDTAKHFIAGLMRHAREITVVTNQWINSYKRLVPRFEAPTFVSWSTINRADLIRVPDFKSGREESRRIEYRAPDPACNPYLAFSVMLAAGLKGIAHRYEIPAAAQSNIFEMSHAERDDLGVEALPANLWEAIHIAERSELVYEALGEQVFKSFISNKKLEWENYHERISDYETERYLPAL